MLIFALDDEPLQLDVLSEAIRAAEPAAEIRTFGYADAAIRAVRDEGLRPAVVFTDIEMPGMTGMELSRVFKQLIPNTNIIFVTGFRQYAPEACALWPSGYVLKPVDADRVRAELDHLRFPAAQIVPHRIRIQCFGNFEVFAGGVPLKFRYSKSKELLAYLVDRRGASLNTAELCVVLWEDAENSHTMRSQFRNIVADLTGTLAQAGGGDVVRKGYNQLSVDMDAFDCDLYAYLQGEPAAAGLYRGEYMKQFSWAETAIGSIARSGPEMGG